MDPRSFQIPVELEKLPVVHLGCFDSHSLFFPFDHQTNNGRPGTGNSSCDAFSRKPFIALVVFSSGSRDSADG